MTYPRFQTGSIEYVVASVTADVELDAQVVKIFIEGTEYTAEWMGNPGETRECRTTDTIDFTDWADDLYQLSVQFADSPEEPLVDAGYIRVRAAPVPVV